MFQALDQSARIPAAPTGMRLGMPLGRWIALAMMALVFCSGSIAMAQSGASARPGATPPKTPPPAPLTWDQASEKTIPFTPAPIGGGPRQIETPDGNQASASDSTTRQSGTNRTKTLDNGLDFWRIFTALGIVIGLIVAAKFGAKYLMGGNAPGRSNKTLQVVTRTTLGPRQQLMLIQVGRRLVLAAHTASNVSPLCEITDPAEVTEILGSIRSEKPDSISKAFSGLFKHEEQKISAAAGKSATTVEDDQLAPARREQLTKLGLRLDIREASSSGFSEETSQTQADASRSQLVNPPTASSALSDEIRTTPQQAARKEPGIDPNQSRLDIIEGVSTPNQKQAPTTTSSIDTTNQTQSAGDPAIRQLRIQSAEQDAAQRARQVATVAMASARARIGGTTDASPLTPTAPETTASNPAVATTADENTPDRPATPGDLADADEVAVRRRDPLGSTQDQINDLMQRLRSMRNQFKS